MPPFAPELENVRPASTSFPSEILMQRSALAGCVLVLASCASGSREVAPSAPAPANRAVATAIVARPTSREEILAYCDARPEEAVVDSVVVSPARLVLRVGDVLALTSLSNTSAVSGTTVPVRYETEPGSAKIEAGGLRAITAGTTVLKVRPLCAVVRNSAGEVPLTSVPVLIQP